MKRTLLISVVLFATLHSSVYAQEKSAFEDIDGMLEELESLSETDGRQELTPTLVDESQVNEVPAEDPVERAINDAKNKTSPGQMSVDNEVLSTRITELPPNTRFEFQKSLFIPAYKSGVMFVGGEPKYSIDSGVSPIDAFEVIEEGFTACALISDKSYLKVNGASGDGAGTFIEVASISFKQVPWRDGMKTVSRIKFKTKQAKRSDNSVSMEIVCRVDDTSAVRNYTLGDINTGFGGIFDYKLPQYIEL